MSGRSTSGPSRASRRPAGSEGDDTGPADGGTDVDAPPIGYGRPPRATRYRPGQSGNPRGRPKGARNLSSVIAAALGERVAITENGRRRRISKLEAAVKQLVNRAASGEARATQLLLQLVRSDEVRPERQAAGEIAEADAVVLAELNRRMQETRQ